MERRDRSVKALSELNYIDSLESFEKADRLIKWHEEYLSEESFEDYDFTLDELNRLKELFFKSINFLNEHKQNTRDELINMKKMQKFLKN